MSRGPDDSGEDRYRDSDEGPGRRYDRERDPGDFGRGYDRERDYGDFRRPPPHVDNYLVPAILCTLFCCLPCGIVAIIQAAQVNGKLAAGDYHGAEASANQAKTWCWISFGLGLVGTVIYLFAFVLAEQRRPLGGF
ncbi:MAG: CD225/dispanin family protein [Gemmataceae bacterium]|nr:CD225/dispanin family protein [Gemmataceae bacterium]